MNQSDFRSLRAVDVLVMAAAGITAGTCFWPGNYGWLFWFVFAPFLWIILERDRGEAFFLGWLFGAAVWLTGMYWFAVPLSKFLNISPAAALPLFLMICLWHGLMFALLAAAVRGLSLRLSRRLGWRGETAAFWTAAPVMALIERFFPMLFPVHFSNTQYFHLPQVQSLELLGPGGTVWLVMAFNAAVYALAKALWERRNNGSAAGTDLRRYPALVFAGVCALVLLNEGYGLFRIKQIDSLLRGNAAKEASLEVAIIQGVVAVEDPAALAVYRRLTAETLKTSGPDVVVWPESVYGRAVGYGPVKNSEDEDPVFDPGSMNALRADLPFRVNMLMGTEGVRAYEGKDSFSHKRNIAFVTGPARELLGLVEKRRLFPFGEFLPLGETFPVLYKLFPYAERISAGDISRPLRFGGVRAGALICYEDVFPEVARRFAGDGANVLFNLTNEARFGYTMIPEQHLNFSALRAIENRKFLLRAVNTGMSAVIDPAGRIIQRLGRKERGALTVRVRLMEYTTFYSRYGNFVYYISVLLLSALLLFSRARMKGENDRI